MQYRKEPPFRAALDRRGPGVGAGRGRMAGEIEDAHDAFPYRVSLEGLADGYGLRERRDAATHVFDGDTELIGFNFGHARYISRCGGHAIGGYPAARPDPLRFFRASFSH
jgi:hypothetical protein